MSASTVEIKRQGQRGLYIVGLGEAEEVLASRTKHRTQRIASSLKGDLLSWSKVHVTVEDKPVATKALEAFDAVLHPNEESHKGSPVAGIPRIEPEPVVRAIQDRDTNSLVRDGLAVEAFKIYLSYLGELADNPRVNYPNLALIRLGSSRLMTALLRSGIDHEPFGDYRTVFGALSFTTTDIPHTFDVNINGDARRVRLDERANRFVTLTG